MNHLILQNSLKKKEPAVEKSAAAGKEKGSDYTVKKDADI